jgi:hypothetical protein
MQHIHKKKTDAPGTQNVTQTTPKERKKEFSMVLRTGAASIVPFNANITLINTLVQ